MIYDRLIKFLEMMSSDHDGEALSAARMANRELKKLKLRWADIIKPPASIASGLGAGMYHPNMNPQNPMGGFNQQYNHPFWQQQQYNPFAQQMAADMIRRQQEDFLRQQEIMRRNIFRQQMNSQQNAYRPEVKKEESTSETAAPMTVDEAIIDREEKKSRSFWQRFQN